jgi:polysaccharide pyruvyl transferase WcaK-like protein
LGNFGTGNLGNEGSLEAMLNFLRSARSSAELVCICEGPARVRELYGIPAIAIRSTSGTHRFIDRIPLARTALNMLYVLGNVRRFDLLIAPGTGLLDDFSDTPWGMPVTLASWCFGARLSGTKIAFVSIGAGPIGHPASRWLMKAAARMVQYRSYRDFASKDFLGSIGLDTRHDAVYPDLAFCLPSPPTPRVSAATEKPTVGVGIMRYYGWSGDKERGADIYRNYLRKLVEFVMWLLDRQYRVRLIIGDEADRVAIDNFLNALISQRPDYSRSAVVYEPANSLQDIMNQISDTHYVVATRFHNIVCALKLGKPCISIGYAPKFDVLMEEMGLGRFCQHIEQLDVDLLTSQLTDLIGNQTSYQKTLDETNEKYQQRLAQQEDVLLSSILA